MNQELAKMFRTLAQKHRAVLQVFMKQHDIYLGQHRVLFRLEENPNITLTELSEILEVSKESLSVSVRRLESTGYIIKQVDEKDKRRTLLTLSDKGLNTSQACRRGFDEVNASMFDGILQIM